MMSDDKDTVWAKGDKCMAPFPHDGAWYSGKIDKLTRSTNGQVIAHVKFDGYEDYDCEEININHLKKIKEKEMKAERHSRKKSAGSSSSGGLFSPLQGSELDQRLRAKYEKCDSTEDERLVDVRNERLSALVLEGKKPSAAKSQTNNQPRKGIIAVGGEPVRKDLNKCKTETTGICEEKDFTSPSRKKGLLNVTGGKAKDPRKELRSSKKLSDISSVLDRYMVTKALDRDSVDDSDTSADVLDTSADIPVTSAHDTGADHVPNTDVWLENDDFSGFDEADLEKPKFTFKPEGAKVPLVLSGDGESPVVQVPATLNQYLRDYQRDGIQFLYTHYENNRGAILGDDMGLGKTVQVIGFLSALLGKQGTRIDVMRMKPSFIRQLSDTAAIKEEPPCRGPFLIIGPGCVLYNWLEELETWGYFSVRKFHGGDKKECLRDVEKGKVEIVVTTFETYRDHEEGLNTIDWKAVIVDEVHKIKDLRAQATKALRKIHTMRRFGLTGTALQNNLTEFYSLLDWAQPECFGSLADFDHEYVKPIEMAQRHDANKRELAFGRRQQEKLSEIRKGMMIRRVKSLIAHQLPRKDDSVVFCRLSQLQTSIYQTILNHNYMHLVLNMDDPCECDSGQPQGKCCRKKTPDGQSIRSLIFTMMHLLLKTSNHVALLVPTKDTSEKQARASRQVCKVAFEQHPEFVKQTKEASFKTLSDPKYCGKMKVLQGLLKVFNKDHSKVLVFSYSTQVLDIIEQHLMSTGYEYRRMDGAVSPKKRMVIVREFNTDPNIFICLISTKAGGLGLNLTGANRVVIFDPNWNPTHDLQAQDRAYRIGQRRNVQVYRLVTTGTIEENMYLRQIYKQQLLNVTVEDANSRRYFYAVQGNRKQKGELFGIKNMFSLRTGDACFTRDILKRNERVESALGGFEMAQYVPPVVRVEEDEEYEDVIQDESSDGAEDWFNQFFSSDSDANDDDQAALEDRKVPAGMKKGRNSVQSVTRNQKNNITDQNISDDSEESDVDHSENNKKKVKHKRSVRVTFKEPGGGKVQPWESRTGKGPARKGIERKGSGMKAPGTSEQRFQTDQTLAGTFSDVSDVFDNCGVVHIHENVKVIGGSRAEDHMTRCAIAEVYELHQNSQELAVQCEPMSESSEDEPPPLRGRKGQGHTVDDHNTPRSTTVGNVKVLIGQTPKAFILIQLDEMRRFHKVETLTQFAELVLDSSLTDRMQLLSSFYESREPELSESLKPDVFTVRNACNCRNEKTPSAARKNEKQREKKTSSKTKGRKVSGRKIGQSIGFLDEVDPDSESLSQKELKPEIEHDNDDNDQIEVGRKITPRKRVCINTNKTPMKKCKIESKSPRHKPVPPSYIEQENIGRNAKLEDQKYESRSRRNRRVDSDMDPNKLLEEMANQSMDPDSIESEGQYSENDILDIKQSDARNSKLVTDLSNREIDTGRTMGYMSVLDDMFTGSGDKPRKKKPPPSKHKTTGTKPPKIAQSPGKNNTEIYDPFRGVDEIFSESANSASSSVDKAMHLETSTLINDSYDCFDDPKLWKKRKRKEPDKRSAVDRLIADSEADYDHLFTSGKLKRKLSKEGGSRDTSQKSADIIDGSASLFD